VPPGRVKVRVDVAGTGGSTTKASWCKWNDRAEKTARRRTPFRPIGVTAGMEDTVVTRRSARAKSYRQMRGGGTKENRRPEADEMKIYFDSISRDLFVGPHRELSHGRSNRCGTSAAGGRGRRQRPDSLGRARHTDSKTATPLHGLNLTVFSQARCRDLPVSTGRVRPGTDRATYNFKTAIPFLCFAIEAGMRSIFCERSA